MARTWPEMGHIGTSTDFACSCRARVSAARANVRVAPEPQPSATTHCSKDDTANMYAFNFLLSGRTLVYALTSELSLSCVRPTADG